MANDEKQAIVVITVHGKDECPPVVFFSYFNTLEDAHRHCQIVNTLNIKEHEWIYARIITDSEKYQLAKPVKYDFGIFKILSDRDIDKIEKYMRYELHLDHYPFLQALKGASGEIQERFFRDYFVNPLESETYSERESATFGEFKSYLESLDESFGNVMDAQNRLLKIVNELEARGELLFPLVKVEDD
jgi:flagellar motor switch protein FliG